MELSPITHTNHNSKHLHAALGIYRRTILPEAQNPESQILYWIDHNNESLADEFRCFALTQKGTVAGYLQYSYFREEHIFFFEYLCIQDLSRNGLAQSRALKSIEDYLAQNYGSKFTIVFEVAQKVDNAGKWKSDRKVINYFERLGFRTVNFDYRYPVLQSYRGESSYPADLMVMLPHNRTEITASEMRTILRCIYFKHYLRWDRPFLESEQFSLREKLINDLYSTQVAEIKSEEKFQTIGRKNSLIQRRFRNQIPDIDKILGRFLSPKMPRIFVVISVLLLTNWILNLMGNGLMLIPFVLAVSLVYCLAENTKETRKLVALIIARLRVGRPRS